jgi:two-component system, sensor histidine kinase PdtaS
VDRSARHLRLLTETIAAVNSTLDLDEVFQLIAHKVAEALETDACFVYLFDEGADELVLRASFGTRVEQMTRVPKMRPGEGITGTAAAERRPVMIARDAHLDPRFKRFPNLREEQYQSILAVPILARERLEGALNVRTKEPREFGEAEIDLLMAIASQVAQAIENAKLYDHAQRRVAELEALAAISEAVSQSLYLEESLEAIVKTTMDAVDATGAALVLEDGTIAWPEGRSGAHAARFALRWKGREIGELVCDRDRPFRAEEERLLASIAHHAAVALEHGRAVMRGVLAQEIHHRVKNNLQTIASLLRLQGRRVLSDEAKAALQESELRIGSIALVHETLSEGPVDIADFGAVARRIGRMVSDGLVPSDKQIEIKVTGGTGPLAADLATPLAVTLTELIQNAVEHAFPDQDAGTIGVELSRDQEYIEAVVWDDGIGIEEHELDAGATLGLQIVRSLVVELGGEFTMVSDGGTRARLRVPVPEEDL